MGSGIAAQVANAGLQVHLLDLTKDIATGACERIKNSRPPLLMEENHYNKIIPGIPRNFNGDLIAILSKMADTTSPVCEIGFFVDVSDPVL